MALPGDLGEQLLNQIPKALPALLIPLVQFVWTKYKESQRENRKNLLRKKIADLIAQRGSLGPVASLENGVRVLQDLENELKAALAELAAIGEIPNSQANPKVIPAELAAIGEIRELQRDPPKRPALARWFLAYTPSGPASWILHSLFFLFLPVGLLAIIAFVQVQLGNNGCDFDLPWLKIPLISGVFLLPAFLFRNIAAWIDKGRPWLPTVMFWFSILMIALVWVAAIADEDDDFVESLSNFVLPATALLFLLGTCALGAVRSWLPLPALPSGTGRSAFLLFVPSRPAGWLALLSWYVGWAMVGLLGYRDFQILHGGGDLWVAVVSAAVGFPLLCGHLVCAWRWARASRVQPTSGRKQAAAGGKTGNIARARSAPPLLLAGGLALGCIGSGVWYFGTHRRVSLSAEGKAARQDPERARLVATRPVPASTAPPAPNPAVESGEPLRILQGHTDSVNSVAWSPDGKILASASDDGTIRLWDTAGGKGPRVLEGHQDAVNSVAWSPDGNTLASASDDETIRLWDATSGELIRSLRGNGGSAKAAAWSPNGRTLASANDNVGALLWDAASGKLLRTLEGDHHFLGSIAWSPDGKTLAAAGVYDEMFWLWDAANGKTLRTLEGHDDWLNSVTWSPDGKMLASASDDGTIRLWDAVSGKTLRILQGPSGGSAHRVAWSPDGRALASGWFDETIRMWDTANWTLRTLQGHKGNVNDVAWSPDGKTLASAGDDKTVRLWAAHPESQ
jgi:glucose/arabinose dehydrogenase